MEWEVLPPGAQPVSPPQVSAVVERVSGHPPPPPPSSAVLVLIPMACDLPLHPSLGSHSDFPYLELEEIVLNLLLAQVQLGGHQLLQGGSHIPSHAHISTHIEVALLPVEHTEYLVGQLLLQDVLNIDLKAEDMVGPSLDAEVPVVRHTYGQAMGREGGPLRASIRTSAQDTRVSCPILANGTHRSSLGSPHFRDAPSG